MNARRMMQQWEATRATLNRSLCDLVTNEDAATLQLPGGRRGLVQFSADAGFGNHQCNSGQPAEKTERKNRHQPIYPLVSALLVSHQRPKQFARAIALWWIQSYPQLEIVLAFDETDIPTAAIARLASHQQASVPVRRQILLYAISDTSLALGMLRSTVADRASGEYLVQEPAA